MTDDITKADRPWYWDVTWTKAHHPDPECNVVAIVNREFWDWETDSVSRFAAGFASLYNSDDAHAELIRSAPATARERDELRERLVRVESALREAEKHFGPFAEITINGQHDPDDVRVMAMIRAALAEGGAS